MTPQQALYELPRMTIKEVFIKYIEELGWKGKIPGDDGNTVYYDNGNINISLDPEKLIIRIYNYKYCCNNNATTRYVDTCDTVVLYYGDPEIFDALDNLKPVYDYTDKKDERIWLKYQSD